MTLREIVNAILNTGSVNKVIDILHDEYFSDDPIGWVDFSYTNSIRELLELTPDDEFVDDHTIDVHVRTGEDGDEINVHLIENSTGESLGIDLIPWRQLVNVKIDDNRIVDKDDIYSLLAHILWEITFYGVTSDQVDKFRADIKQQIADIQSGDAELIEWDDVKKSFLDE